VRTGMRAPVSDSAFAEASVGYFSFGQPGLDAFEGRLYLSVGF